MTLQDVETRLFQLGIVVIVDDIEADDFAAGGQQALSNMKADKAGSSGD